MHTDSELLSLLAVGELVGTDDERAHAETCPVCAEELAELRRVVELGRRLGPETPGAGALDQPSPSVWQRVRDELGLADSVWAPEPSAHADLRAVTPEWSGASATAELATDALGRRVLQLALQADLLPEGLREAWLVHRQDPSRRQSLGILDGRYGLWTVDHSIDLELYAILEVSEQGTAGGDAGAPVVRGELLLGS